MDIELMIKGFLLAWIITAFTPFQDALNKLKAPRWIKYILSVLQCFKCTSLYVTWALTGDIFSAIAVSFIAATYDRVINSFKTYL